MAYTSEIDKLERRLRENPTGLTFAPLAEQYRKAGDVARALEVLKTGLELHPNYVAGNIVFGRCNFDIGNYAESETAFRKVLDSDSENVIALQALADIAERQNRFDDSGHWLSYLLNIDAGNDQARKQMARLEMLRVQQEHFNRTAIDAEADQGEPVAESAASRAEAAPSEETPAMRELQEALDTIEISPSPHVSSPPVEEPAPEPIPETTVAEDVTEPVMQAFEPEPAEPLTVDEPAGAPATEFLLDEDPIGAPTADLRGNDMGVERHEEIVLRPSATSEFQAPSDAELLSGSLANDRSIPAFEEEALAPSGEAAESPAVEAENPNASEPVRPEALWQAHPEDATPEEPPVPTPEPGEFETPRPELAALPQGSPVDEASDMAEAEEAAEGPEPLVTETIGDVYAAQGHRTQALDVYRQLLLRTPGDLRITEKIQELEKRESAVSPQRAAAFAAEQTGGQSVRSYFGDLLAARLPEENGSDRVSEPASTESSSTHFMEEAFKTDEEPGGGEPTRPASGPLSLSAIFGEDPSPVPPVISGAEPVPSETAPSHFDEFFGEQPAASGSTTRARSVRLETDQDDLDQFHKWLKGLKR
jgi:tetratricopeptide (TPR) repeat protein